MLRKLRLKFVAICMALVTAVLAAVFFAVYFSMERTVENLSRQVLVQVVENSGGLSRPNIGITIGGDRVLLPYFTVDVWGTGPMSPAVPTPIWKTQRSCRPFCRNASPGQRRREP